MVFISLWKSAQRPNYDITVDLRFPYSEVLYLGDYELVKIPFSLNNLIQHVDYWGEGKITDEDGSRGFSNCYNVNHQYQLVSSGCDLNKKIPNRIPVHSEDNCDTSSYIKDNSVLTVTIAGARITSNCVKDIARIVNNDHGKVVVYGRKGDSQEISELADELKKKGLISSLKATLPRELQGLTYYNSQTFIYLNVSDFADQLFNDIFKDNNYDGVVNAVSSLGELKNGGEIIIDILMRLISAAPRKAMSFAYKVWHEDTKSNVRKHLPKSFQHIFNEDAVTVVNKLYKQPLKLDLCEENNHDFRRIVWGDDGECGITSLRVSWKVVSEWSSDRGGVTFKLFNIHRSLYLQLAVNKDNNGERQAFGATNSNEGNRKFYLEPSFEFGSLVFAIVNYEYNQPVRMDFIKGNVGDRLVWGHNGSVTPPTYRFKWAIAKWNSK